MEYFCESIAPLKHWHINPKEKRNSVYVLMEICPQSMMNKVNFFFQTEYECSMYGSTLLKQLFITE